MNVNEKEISVKSKPNITDELFVISQYDTLAAEAIRTLRTNIILRDFEKQIKVISVMSIIEAQGKTTIISNLAASFAQLGKRVLLIDGDLHIPTVHHKLNIKNGFGLVDVVSGFKTFEECVVHYMNDLDVLTAGTSVPFASEFVQSSALQNFITTKRDQYDFIFIDCPPIVPISDALIVSKYTDGALLIIAAGESDRKILRQSKERLDDLDINVLGIVLNKAEMSKHHYGYNYRYNR